MNITCMENNNIGTIDTLMIARSMLQQGYQAIKHTINNHQFTIEKFTDSTPSEYISINNPYYITHHCQRYENSALSDQVFEMINKIAIHNKDLPIKNSLNQSPHAVDECTQYKIKNSDEVIVTAAFYNKKALMKTLNRVHKYMQQIT